MNPSTLRRASCVLIALMLIIPAALIADEPDPGAGYTLTGQIKPRSAREIKSSNWSVGAETMDRDFTVYDSWKSYLGPLGAKKARLQSGWAKTEKAKGQYDWAWLDAIVNDMVDQGVEPWMCICYGNPIYEGGGGTGLGGGIMISDEALAAWDRYVAALVDRYKAHIDEWEIWNEPRGGKKNTPQMYADLLIRTARIVRKHQPDAKILGFAMAGIDLKWVKNVLDIVKQQNALGLINELNYHPYSYNPDDSYPKVIALRELAASYDPRITIRQGENGAPSQGGSFGAIAKYEWTEQLQAKWALRRLLGDLGRDIPTSYFSICDMQYPSRRNFKGLLAIHDDKTVDHPKEAYAAVQHLTAIFDDTVKRITDFEGSVNGASELKDYALFGYDSPRGPIVTIWRSSDTPGKKPDMERATVTLKSLKFKQPVWVDLRTGKVYAMDTKKQNVAADATTFADVPIYDSVILIAERDAIPVR